MSRTIKGVVIASAFADGCNGRLGEELQADVDGEDEGQAVELVLEDAEGRIWLWSMDRATQVNFCPFSGKKARVTTRPTA